MNELNTLETRLNNLLEQDEAINVDASDKGLEELRKNIEVYDSIKDAAWNYDEAHPEKSNAEKAIIDRITDVAYEKVNELNRVLVAKEAQYLEDGREVISIRRQIRELDRRIDKNQSIVSVERGPGLENSESFMKLINDSENELKEDTAKRNELKARMAELTRNMRNLKYGGDAYIRSVAEDEKRRAEMGASEPTVPTTLPPELDTPEEPKEEDDLGVTPIGGVPSGDDVPTELPPELEPTESEVPTDETELPPELSEDPLSIAIPVPVGGDNGTGEGTSEGTGTSDTGVEDSTSDENEQEETEEQEQEEDEDEVVAIANPKPSLWKKVGGVLKKAVLYLAAVITAVSTLGTAYHTGHTDSDIHDISNTISGISDTLTEMGEEDDLDLDEDEPNKEDDLDSSLNTAKPVGPSHTNTVNSSNELVKPSGDTTQTPSETPQTPSDTTQTPSETPQTPSNTTQTPSETPSDNDTLIGDNTLVGRVGEKEVIEKVSTGENINSEGEVFDRDGNILGDSNLNKDNDGSSLVTGGDFTPDTPATAPDNDTEPTYEGWNDPSKSEQENENIDDAFDNAFNPSATTTSYEATDISEVDNFDNFWSSFSNDIIGNAQTNQETNGQTLNRSM